MEMKPENFVDYLLMHFDSDKAEISKTIKLKIIDWLGNVLEKARQHREWFIGQYDLNSYNKIIFKGKTLYQFIEDELENEMNRPCSHTIEPKPAKQKSFKRELSYLRMFSRFISKFAWVDNGALPQTIELPKETSPEFKAILNKDPYQQFKDLVEKDEKADKDVITGSIWGSPSMLKKS